MGMQHLSGSTDSELQVSRRILLSRGDSQKGPSGGVGGGTGTEHQDCSGNKGRSLSYVLQMGRAADVLQTRSADLLASSKERSGWKRKKPPKELSTEN